MNLPHVAIYYANIINIIYRCYGRDPLSLPTLVSRWGGSISPWDAGFWKRRRFVTV